MYSEVFNPACRGLNLRQNKFELDYVLKCISLSNYEVHFHFEYRGKVKQIKDIDEYLSKCTPDEKAALQ
jgi:hypothetical protein